MKHLFLSSAVLFVFFLPSYVGQELISESEKLNQSLFDFLQVKKSKKLTSSLLIVMERLKHPFKVRAFGVFTINLDTFLNIINMAYSLFTAMKTVLNGK
jgi:hypothetical protein